MPHPFSLVFVHRANTSNNTCHLKSLQPPFQRQDKTTSNSYRMFVWELGAEVYVHLYCYCVQSDTSYATLQAIMSGCYSRRQSDARLRKGTLDGK